MKFSFNRKQKKADTESGDGVQGALRISAEEDMKALSVGGRPFVFILLGAFILMICACAAAFFIMVKGAEEVLVPNVEGKDLYGENAITVEHMQNNKSVRDMLGQRGIRPEELPPAEDIKKLERRVASEHKKIEKSSSKLPKKK